MATSEVGTSYTDEQLADIRYAIEKFNDIRCERDNIVREATVEIAGGKEVRIRYSRPAAEFVAEL